MKKNIKMWLALSIVIMLCLAAPIVLLMPGCTTSDDTTSGVQVQRGNVTGVVTRAADGTAMENVTVTINESEYSTEEAEVRAIISDETDRDGRYTLLNIAEGTQIIRARRSGFANVSDYVEIIAGETTTVNFEMEAVAGGSVTGRASNAIDGFAMPNVQVYIGELMDVTDSDGNYEINGIPAGDYVLQAQADASYQVFRNNVTITEGETTSANIAMPEVQPDPPEDGKANIYGRVKDGSNRPVNGVLVQAFVQGAPITREDPPAPPPPAPPPVETSTGSEGTYILEVNPGTYQITYTKGSDTETKTVTVTEGDNKRADTVTLGTTPTPTPTVSPTGTPTPDPGVGTVLVSERTNSPSGNAANSHVSEDGTKVVFNSDGDIKIATGIGIGEPAGIQQVYLWTNTTGTLIRVSKSTDNPAQGANGDSTRPRISPDGKRIVFESTATNVVTPVLEANPGGIFIYDVENPSVETVALGDAASERPDISNPIAGGNYNVAFQSLATNLGGGIAHTGGYKHIYLAEVKPDGDVVQRRMLDRHNVTESDNAGADPNSENPRISKNGRYTVFQSQADTNIMATDPVSAGNNTTYIYRNDNNADPAVGWNIMVSKTTNGDEPDPLFDPASPLLLTKCEHPAINEDGTKIVFQSNAPNFAGGTAVIANVKHDIYLKNMGNNQLEYVSLPKEGEKGDSTYPSIDRTGNIVAFGSTSKGLVTDYPNATGINQIYVKDISSSSANVYTLVSRPQTGTAGDELSENAQISGNGNFVVFESDSTNFVTPNLGGTTNIFRRKWR